MLSLRNKVDLLCNPELMYYDHIGIANYSVYANGMRNL